MTAMMWAAISSEQGPQIVQVPRPTPTAGQILVRVEGAGLNRADLSAARAVPPRPLGMEWSGEVVALGAGVRQFALGERVMCSGAGGYAGYAVAEAGRSISLAGLNLTPEIAATLPLALMTAHDAVISKGALTAGQSVLVQGASTAVGQMALRIARWRKAGAVIATSREADRREALRLQGATVTLDSSAPDLVAQTLAATDGRGADLVIDMLGGASLNAAMAMTAIRGRIVNVGRLAGNTTNAFDCDLHAARQIHYIGVTFRTRTAAEVAQIVTDMMADLRDPLARGDLSLPISARFALGDVALAHDLMRSNRHFGKILLRP